MAGHHGWGGSHGGPPPGHAAHPQATPQQAQPQQGHPQQGHPQQGHPQQGHPQQGHPQQGHPQQGHPQQGHPQQGHPQQGHPQQGHPQQPGWNQQQQQQQQAWNQQQQAWNQQQQAWNQQQPAQGWNQQQPAQGWNPQATPAPALAPAAPTGFAPGTGHGGGPSAPAVPSGDAIARFEETGVYQRQASAEQIRNDIVSLRGHDAVVEARARRSGRWCTAWWVLTVLSFVVGVILPPLLVFFAAFIIAAIVQTIRWRRAKKLDVENRRYELCDRVLTMISPDLDPAEPLHVRLDLRPADHAMKLKSQTKRDPWTIKLFHDEWLWMSAALLDGSRLTFRFAERKVVRSGWKRGSSGKMKHKTKAKSKYDLALQIAVKPRKHPNIDQMAQRGRPAIKLPHYMVPKSLQCKKGQLRLKASLLGEWNEPGPADATPSSGGALGALGARGPRISTGIAAMLLSLYQIINLSRKLYDQQKGAPR